MYFRVPSTRFFDWLDVGCEKKRSDLKIFGMSTGWIKLPSPEMGKALRRIAFEGWLGVSFLTCWVCDIFYTSKWRCWVSTWGDISLEFRRYNWRVMSIKMLFKTMRLNEIIKDLSYREEKRTKNWDQGHSEHERRPETNEAGGKSKEGDVLEAKWRRKREWLSAVTRADGLCKMGTVTWPLDLAKWPWWAVSMEGWIGIGSRETRRRGIGKSKKKQMMTGIIVKSMTELGKTSRGKNAFLWVLELPPRTYLPIYLCMFMYSCKSSQHATSSAELGH